MPDATRDLKAQAEEALEALAGAIGRGVDEPEEGRHLQRAYEAATAAMEAGQTLPLHATSYLFMRLCAHDRLRALGPVHGADDRLAEAGARIGVHLQVQMARVGPTIEDRLRLLGQRRVWGEAKAAAAAEAPLERMRRPAGGKIRLGFVSNDLRQTNIGVFAWPLFEHRDRERFEIGVYTAYAGLDDPIQQLFKGWSDRWVALPGAAPRELAQAISSDGVDVLVEFGNPYGWEVAAFRPAPLQISWMGCIFSAGLPSIDHIVVDRFLAPEAPTLRANDPLFMPGCWIAMTPAYFEEEPRPGPIPEARKGYITYGTMNAPYKYSEACLDLWARVVAATPDSRFVMVRREAAAPIFRDNICKAFAAHGVAPERIGFVPRRSGHMPFYNEIDICLDTFPLTGGTTTCETLWMGVPVISLAGAAAFERMSYSILENAGLGELVAHDPASFVQKALALASDRPRRETLKAGLRERIRTGPLGRTEGFAHDFYDLVARAVEARAAVTT